MANPLLVHGTRAYDPAYAGHDWQDLNPMLPASAERIWEIDEQLRGMTQRLAVGSAGDAQQLFVPTAGYWADLRFGTAAAPDTSLNPPLKVTRTVALVPMSAIASIVGAAGTVTVRTATSHYLSTGMPVAITGTVNFNGTYTVAVVDATHFTYASAVVASETVGTAQQNVAGNNGEQQAAILAISVGVPGNTAQVTALAGVAINRSSSVDFRNDSAAVYAFAWQDVDTTNGAEAIFAASRRTHDSAYSQAIEVQVQNFASPVVAGNIGVSQAVGIGISAGASSTGTQVGAGIVFVRGGVPVLDVGLNVPSYSTISDGNGPCKTAVIQDNGKSLWSYYLKGSHANAAFAIEDQAGPLLVGVTGGVAGGDMVGALAVFRDSVGSTGSATLWVGSQSQVGSTGDGKPHFVQLTNFAGRHRLFIAGVAGDHMVGSQHGDGGWLVFQPGTKAILGGFNGGGASRAPVLTFTYDGKFAAYGVTPVLRAGATDDLRSALISYGWLTGGGATPLNLNGGALTAGSGAFATSLSVGGVAAVLTTDARLSDARTPTAHHASHETGGADALTALAGSVITTGTVAAARLPTLDALTAPAANVSLNGHSLTNVATVALASPATWAVSNVTTDRTLDADATSIDELADAFGTLVADLRTAGLVA